MSHKLALNRCPRHGVETISIDDDDGHGTRLTPGKCCGVAVVVKEWPLIKKQWDSLVEEVVSQTENDE